MKVLVTGGRGFIGRHVVAEARKRGHDVRVLARPDGGESPTKDVAPGIVRHDLREREGLTDAVSGVDAVVHCAASMGGDEDEQESVTVDGTTNLLSAMSEAGVRHIVVLSTFAIYDYDAIPRGSLLDEESPLEEDFDSRSPYVWTKRKQEDLVRTVAGASGWRWTVLRPGVVYGPGRTWFYHLGTQPSANRWISYGGAALFPVTFVENLAEAVVLALESEAADGATLNLVDDGLPTRRMYLEVLARLTKRRPTVLDVPWDMLEPAARSATWVHRRVLLGRVPLPDLLRHRRLQARCKPLAYSNERAKNTLGWQPRYSFEEGMRRSFAHVASDGQATSDGRASADGPASSDDPSSSDDRSSSDDQASADKRDS